MFAIEHNKRNLIRIDSTSSGSSGYQDTSESATFGDETAMLNELKTKNTLESN